MVKTHCPVVWSPTLLQCSVEAGLDPEWIWPWLGPGASKCKPLVSHSTHTNTHTHIERESLSLHISLLAKWWPSSEHTSGKWTDDTRPSQRGDVAIVLSFCPYTPLGPKASRFTVFSGVGESHWQPLNSRRSSGGPEGQSAALGLFFFTSLPSSASSPLFALKCTSPSLHPTITTTSHVLLQSVPLQEMVQCESQLNFCACLFLFVCFRQFFPVPVEFGRVCLGRSLESFCDVTWRRCLFSSGLWWDTGKKCWHVKVKC